MGTRIALAVCVVLGCALCGRALADAARRRANALKGIAEGLRVLKIHMTGMLEPVQCALRSAKCPLFALVADNMGKRFMGFAPFVCAILGLSAFSSLSSLLGLFPPTSDMNVVAGWAILVFVLITHYKLKGGVWPYVKGFFEPVPVFMPFNVIGEFATPVSMSFRHYGNVLSGVVIATLVHYALGSLSHMILGWLPGFLGNIPLLRIGVPAVLSVYFDIFSGCMQAFIFAMLTMLYIATGAPAEE